MPLLKPKIRVLVLDDDPAMQRLIPIVLRRAGHRVDVVSEGSQAIEHIGRNEYSVLLLDLMTPTDGGLTVMKHLKKSNPKMLQRVILVTASPESLLRSIAGDAAAVVHKPFEAEELLATVKRVLTQQ